VRKDNKVDVDYVKVLLDLVDKNKLEELSIQEGPILVEIKGKESVVENPVITTGNVAPVTITQEIEEDDEEEEIEVEEDANIFNVTAPLVGTYYTAQSPDVPPYVTVGDTVNIGTELGLIEAMKVFSPIPSEVSGEVISINVKSGELVKKGQVILKIRVDNN